MRQRRLKNEINVVPYIDVMLVLLVIFMVATPMMTTGSVDLPTSGTAPKKPDSYVKVEIKKDGAISIYSPNGKEKKLSSLKELKSELSAYKTAEIDKMPPVMIAGDMATQYKNVMEALDEIKKAGFQRVGLETGVK